MMGYDAELQETLRAGRFLGVGEGRTLPEGRWNAEFLRYQRRLTRLHALRTQQQLLPAEPRRMLTGRELRAEILDVFKP